ncbi:phage gp6-like head-tail connector protein [Pseudomonas syringae]|nr:phage gp6-like head-tail connector protein [Pseudomonas syringae]MBD8790960.1 phage gp6-like head-tail connector protein [Pseudomonas syringae]MBD8801903.1 phage gp6-like head-tail connector protein [Pseudomonas syringae]MBD8811747.1 phage gp6-like head-tail connector protein [Pseudomonas syringae]
MSVIDIDLAMRHLLAEPEDQVLIQAQLDASEEAAAKFIQRRLFADDASAATAKAGVPNRLGAARAAYEAAKVIAETADHSDDRCRLELQAHQSYIDAVEQIDMDANGIVINPAITAGCLLKLGHLYANREEVVVGVAAAALPLASQSLLMPYRIGMGV